MSRLMTKPTKWPMRPAKTKRSAWVFTQSDQSLHCPHQGTLGPQLSTQCTAKTDAQADLSLRWVHRTFCWFWHAAAQMYTHNSNTKKMKVGVSNESWSSTEIQTKTYIVFIMQRSHILPQLIWVYTVWQDPINGNKLVHFYEKDYETLPGNYVMQCTMLFVPCKRSHLFLFYMSAITIFLVAYVFFSSKQSKWEML